MDHYGFLFAVSDSVKGPNENETIFVCVDDENDGSVLWEKNFSTRDHLRKEYLPYCNDTTGREERNLVSLLLPHP